MSGNCPVRLVIADDHPLVLSGLSALFPIPEYEVLGAFLNGEDAVASISTLKPTVAILDIAMPQLTGVQALSRIRQQSLPTKVVLLSAAIDNTTLMEVIELGVEGLVLKEAAPRLLIQCVDSIVAGRKWYQPELVERSERIIRERMLRQESLYKKLSSREMEIVSLAGKGLRNKEIARRTGLTEGTVKIHLHNVYGKLNVTSRFELIELIRQEIELGR